MHSVFVLGMIRRVDIRGNLIQMRMTMRIINFIAVYRKRGREDGGRYLTIGVLENGEYCVSLEMFSKHFVLFAYSFLLHVHILWLKQCLHQRSFTSCCSKLYRTAEEEEGIRASEAIDRILSRLSKSDVVVKGKPII
mmetsp:Transcript_4932/g.7215  ORF Transcript_4932/g.7215 Transcript_4932/m.7215 type:complete len:137 (+) Transcript_4932:582-992(+)